MPRPSYREDDVVAQPPPTPSSPSGTSSTVADEEAPPEGDSPDAAGSGTLVIPSELVGQRRGLPHLPCFFVIHRLMGTNGEQGLHVNYPLAFRAGAVVTFFASLFWLLHFFLRVFPETTQVSDGPCRFSDDQLRQNAVVLFAYFLCFAVVRICIFFPGVAARVAEIQLGYQGIWRMYALHMILHGPLYIFGIGSVLFGFQLLMSPKCENDPETPKLHVKLGWYASFSCGVFAISLILAFFQSRLITNSASRQEEEKRKAPKGTLEKLLTYIYKDHKELFGEEDGKLYADQCPICLAEWEDDDVIKITACGHCFHKECIGYWMKTERTCAFCRQDLVNCPGRSTSRDRVPSSPANTSRSPSSAAASSSSASPPVAEGNSLEASRAVPEAQIIGVSAGETDDGVDVEAADETEPTHESIRVGVQEVEEILI